MENLHVLIVFIWFCLGCISAYVAHKKKKNPYLWFFIGFFLGLIGLIILFLTPQKKEVSAPSLVMASAYPSPATPEDFPAEIAMPKTRIPTNPKIHWYYIDSHKVSQGPLNLDQIKCAYTKGVINASTLIWNEEIENWILLKDFNNYQFIFQE
ncbi:MAG: DUF4339 domain-containing protein [Chlamydiae bacterium]|nr:DUF4339 domain-containing protein [Chlamydiota bacterium]